MSVRRHVRISIAAVAALLLIAALVPWGMATAFANTSGNAPFGNFEIDGNLYDGTANSTTATTHANGAADDWINLMPQPAATDVIGTGDTTTFTGSKECSTPDGNCQPDDWGRATTGLAPDKTDIGKVFVGSRLVPDPQTGDLWGYFGITRASNDGTTFFDFELNQSKNHTNGTGTSAISVPTRTPGDVLIVAQQQGSGPHASFNVSATIQRWTTDDGACASGLTALGSAHGCWTVPVAFPNGAFYGLANDSSITSIPSGTVASNEFAEFAADLSAVGAVVGCPSTGFVSLNVRSRASNSDSAEIKDYVQADVGVPSACGELKIEKFADDGKTLLPGATFKITPNPLTGTGDLTIKDNTTHDGDPTDGVVTTPAIPTSQLSPAGTKYSVEETIAPDGYLLPTSNNPRTGIAVNKFASGTDAVVVPFTDTLIKTKLSLTKSSVTATFAKPGDVLTYNYVATNNGNVPLTPPYSVSDDKTSVTCDQTPNPLPVGGTFNCTASYTVTQRDIDAGKVTNVATASANYGDKVVTSDPATATVKATQSPELSLDKTSKDTSFNVVGQVLVYDYTLTNTGNVTLSQPYAVSDDKSTDESCPATPATLLPGDTVKCTATYSVTQTDLDHGSVTNVATATAHEFSPDGETVKSDPAQLTIDAAQGPGLGLMKTATESTYDHVGQVLSYTYTLTNTGNVSLTEPYAVHDDKISNVDCSDATSPLAVGAMTTCTATYTVTQADLDRGHVTNHATATATFRETEVPSNEAQATVQGVQSPALGLVKTATEPNYSKVGDALHYTYVLTNAGNVTLSLPYTVADDKSSDETCPATPTKLAPGAQVTCTATYTVTQADLDAGSVTNHATATAVFGEHFVTSNEAHATVPAVQTPVLQLAKTATEASYSAPGDVLHYGYTLLNAGNVTLVAPYTVSDDKIASVSCPTTPASLAPGASLQCSAAYTVTQADIDAGSVVNHATATAVFGGKPVTSNPDDATVPAVQSSGLALVKSVDKTTASYGDTLTYTLKATNTGNVDLTGVVVSDVIPKGTSYVDGSASPNASFDSGSGAVSWTVGALAAGGSVDGLTFQVTIDQPTFDPTVGLPAETIDNVGSVLADNITSTPSNHVKTPVTAVLGVKVVRKPAKKPVVVVLPFTGTRLPLGPTVWVATLMVGAGLVLTSVRRRGKA